MKHGSTMTRSKRYPKKLFTTGEIARIVNTTAKTVARWIDEGTIVGIHLPGMVERRVHRDEARAFFVRMGWTWAIKEIDAWDGPDPEEPPAEGPKPPPRRTPKAPGK